MDAIKPVMRALLQESGGSPGSATSEPLAKQTAPARNESSSERKERERVAAIRTAQPGAGVRDGEIAALLHEGKGVTTATGFQYQESVDLLLKNGDAYRGLEIPPEDLNVDASRRMEPEKWCRWRQQGSHYYFQNKSGQWEGVDAEPAEPLEPGARLNRDVIYRSAVSFGGFGGSVFTREFRFTPNGRFERSKSSLHGTGAVQAAGEFSSGAASQEDRNGRQSTAMGTYSGPNGTVGATSQSRGGGSEFRGTYDVRGYALELHTDSGRVERILAFYPRLKPGNADIFIDDVTFYNPNR